MSILNRRSQAIPDQGGKALTATKRILVLGSSGHGRAVQAYQWDQLPQALNVADHEVVILNFAAFEDRAVAEDFPIDRLPDRRSMTRLLFSPGSELVAIGDPRTLIGPPPDHLDPRLFDSRKRADYWLPFRLQVEDNSGQSYSVTSDDWQPFFNHLTVWNWIISGDPNSSVASAHEYLSPVTDDADSLSFKHTPVAETRFQKPIAIRLSLLAQRILSETPGPVLESGPVYWLPTPDKISAGEAIDLLLRGRYGIAQEARVPEWIDDYSLPAEAPIADEIDRLNHELEERGQQLSAAARRAEDAARPRRLLFEKGKQTLEPIVRDALREVGARVDDPAVEGIEDGLLFRGEQAAVIEIKGREGAVKQADIRQVVQWASDAKLRDGVAYKPLIVANPYCNTKLEDRGEPLTGNAKSYAENGEVALLTTSQLFEAVRRYQLGELDVDAFWSEVFQAKGVVDLPGPATPARADALSSS